MTSRTLQVVSFVKQYIARWGRWPSYSEIGNAVGVCRSHARKIVQRAIAQRLLDRAAGARRPIEAERLAPDDAAELIARLNAAGYIMLGETPDGRTIRPLPILPALTHTARGGGEGGHDGAGADGR